MAIIGDNIVGDDGLGECNVLSDFPDELMQLIFSHLDWETIYMRVIFACKQWHLLCFDNNFLYNTGF